MKKILIPTDSSEAANNAARYAIELFGKNLFAGKVQFTLLHVHNYIPSTVTNISTPDFQSTQFLEAKRERLVDTAEMLRTAYPDQQIGYALEIGNIAHSVSEYVKKEFVDFVVVGSHPKSGLDRWIEGLNAHTIATESNCPVLVIPESAKYKALEKVIFATDFKNLHDHSILNPLREIVDTSGSQFLLLHIYPEKESFGTDKELANESLETYFGADKYQYFFLEDNDPGECIEEFALSYHSDILALTTQDRGFFESLYHKSVTKKLIVHSQLPLLILNESVKRSSEEKDTRPLKEKLEEQVSHWRSELEALNVQFHLGKKEAAQEWEDQRKKANKKIQELEEKLDTLEDIAEDRWDHFKDEMSTAINHIKKAFVGKKDNKNA